jgi:adenosine deaminase
MGPVAAEVHSRRVPLEVTLVSNLDTGMYPTASDHPVGLLHRAGFVVTLSTDNRLMSATSMVREYTTVLDHCGIGIADLAIINRNAVAAAFCDEATRARVAQRVEAGHG